MRGDTMSTLPDVEFDTEEIPLSHYLIMKFLNECERDGVDTDDIMDAMENCRDIFIIEETTFH